MAPDSFENWPVHPDGVEGVTIHHMPAEAVGVEPICDACDEPIKGNAFSTEGLIFHSDCAPWEDDDVEL